jgi:hypothetical protein
MLDKLHNVAMFRGTTACQSSRREFEANARFDTVAGRLNKVTGRLLLVPSFLLRLESP